MKPAKPIWPAGALAALTGINLLNYLDRQVLHAVLTPIKAELHWSDTRLGGMATAFMLGYFLTAPLFGYLGDRFSRKWLIAVGVFVWSLGTLLTGQAHGYMEMILFRILVGFGEASYGSISPSWLADLFPPARRNNALSLFYSAIPVGSALGYIIGGMVAVHWGWRAAFLWAGAPGLFLAVALLWLKEPERGQSDPSSSLPAPAKADLPSYLNLRRSTPYLLVVAGYVAQTFAMGGFAVWAPTFLVRVRGMAVGEADRFFGVALLLTGLIATLVGGAVGTAWQKRHRAGYAWLLAVSAVAAVPASFGTFAFADLRLAEAALIAAMFLIFVGTGPINTLILETVPVLARARAMAASIFAIHLFGDLWSPPLVGALSDRWGDLKEALLRTLPAGMLVCAVFWVWLALRQSRAAPAGAA